MDGVGFEYFLNRRQEKVVHFYKNKLEKKTSTQQQTEEKSASFNMQKNIKMRGKEVETFALGSFSFRNIFSLFAKKKIENLAKRPTLTYTLPQYSSKSLKRTFL